MLDDQVQGREADPPTLRVSSASNLLNILNPSIGSVIAVKLSQIN